MSTHGRTTGLLVAGLLVGWTTAGCGGGGSPPLSSAKSLACPYPGLLPFRLPSSGFHDANNKDVGTTEPRSKDEASDTLGVPNGVNANIYTPDAQAPAAGPIDYHGYKARTGVDQGLFSDALANEPVSLWTYDTAAAAWRDLGQGQTDDRGFYDLAATGFVAANGQPVYAMLDADGSCAVHYDWLYPAGTRFVVADIDGTLTTSDNELLMELTDGSYTPAMMTAANTMLQDWAKKGYVVVYLTARPHLYRAETRQWLDQLGFPPGPVITANNGMDPQPYKTLWLQRMINDFGWTAVAAYGNATTDVGAYAAAGIATNVTFIIGPVGGQGGTVAIANNDYTSHIASFVDAQPSVH
jgi:hypothetical protein